MSKTVTTTLCLCFFILGVSLAIEAQDKPIRTRLSTAASSNREQDGLNGPVRRVRLETAQILVKEGKAVAWTPRASGGGDLRSSRAKDRYRRLSFRRWISNGKRAVPL